MLDWNNLDWSDCSAVERSPQKVSGVWVFRNSRVAISALFENLESGVTINDFLELFPGLERNQIEAVLEFATRNL
jgi:uncharacterized protein (DUF433 family)